MAKKDASPPTQSLLEAEASPLVRPLTRRDYVRTEATQRQIADSLGLDPEGLIVRAQQRDKDAPDYLSAEALVYFIRRADSGADGKTRDALIRELLERCTVFFRGQLRGCKNEEDRRDLQSAVITNLIEDLLAPDDRGDFMQVRFWRYLKRRTISVWNKFTRNAGKTESLDVPAIDEDGAEGGTKQDLLTDDGLTLEQLTTISGALAKLPPNVRRAFILRHAFGVKIGADNLTDDPPNEVTLARHFGCSGRTIRNWLKEAETRLSGFREKYHDDKI